MRSFGLVSLVLLASVTACGGGSDGDAGDTSTGGSDSGLGGKASGGSDTGGSNSGGSASDGGSASGGGGASGGASGGSPSGGAGAGGSGGAEAVCTPGEKESCFEGAPEKEGVGACKAGLKTCLEDGSGYGLCEGQVLPTTEKCIDEAAGDFDCNGGDNDITDVDGDGFTVCEGDCCETTDTCASPAKVNPAAAENLAGLGVDENCNGTADEAATVCDAGLVLDDVAATSAAKTLGVCQEVGALDKAGYGLVNAKYVRADGTLVSPGLQTGIMQTFGTNVPASEGERLLVLSSGRARTPSQAGVCSDSGCSDHSGITVPGTFFAESCSTDTKVSDDVGLELTLRAPSNATGFSFDFRFYTFEYPQICTQFGSSFNDHFVAVMTPAPEGLENRTVAFDGLGKPVSAYTAHYEVCADCDQGTTELAATGFDTLDPDGAAATGKLTSTVPVTPGQTFVIRFVIWDGGDGEQDSSAVLDNLRWVLD